MNFGEAIEAAKSGKAIARDGWNGRGMLVAYMPPMMLSAEQVNERTKRFVPEGPLHVGGYFAMRTAQGVWQPGWLASQADMLAEDWTTL